MGRGEPTRTRARPAGAALVDALRRSMIASTVDASLRIVVGIAFTAIVGLSLLLPHDADIHPTAWLVVVAAGALFAATLWPAVDRVQQVGGGVIVAVLIGLLIAATGGADSAYQDLFAVLLVFIGATRSAARLAVDLVAVALVAAAPAVYDDQPVAVLTDLTIDLAVWVAVALVARVVSRWLSESSTVQRELAAIVQAADLAVVSLDLDGRVRTWNPAASTLFGYGPDEIVGRPEGVLWVDGHGDGARDGTEATPLELARAEGPTTIETVRRHRDGRPVEVEVTVSPVRGEDGTINGAVLLYRDLSRRRAYERAVRERDQRLRTLGELAQGIVYRLRLHPEPAVEYVNAALTTLTGYTAEELRADPGLLLRHDPDEPRGRPADTPTTSPPRAPAPVTYRLQTRDGRWVWLEDHRVPEVDEDGRVVAVEGIAFDVSVREETERAREAALGHERAAAQQLRRTVEMQQTFLQAVSHELRTPLTVVLGLAETVHHHAVRLSTDDAATLLGRLVHHTRRLGRLLEDLLDLNRLGQGAARVTPAATDLAAVCRDLVEHLDAPEHDVHLAALPDEVNLDAPKVERIVDNLLRNAVRHTPPGTRVELRSRRDGDDLVLTVEDDGPGVPPELHDRLFEPFVQGPQASAAPSPGTGVGLALVARFARLHGGEAWHEPRPGGGTRMHVRLGGAYAPLDRDGAAGPAAPDPAAGPPPP